MLLLELCLLCWGCVEYALVFAVSQRLTVLCLAQEWRSKSERGMSQPLSGDTSSCRASLALARALTLSVDFFVLLHVCMSPLACVSHFYFTRSRPPYSRDAAHPRKQGSVGRMACVPKNGMLSHSWRRLQRVETGSGGGEPTVLGQANAIS